MQDIEDIRCICGELIFKSYQDTGKVKIRSAVLVFEREVAKAVCRRCKIEHEVPIVINEELSKSIREKVKKQRLFLRERVRNAAPPEIVLKKKV